MRKKFLLFGIITSLIIMLVFLTGCGKSTKDDNHTTNEKEESSATNNIKLNAGYRYTFDDGYYQLDLYDDGSVVETNHASFSEIIYQYYGTYTIEGNQLTIKLSEESSSVENSRRNFPDGDWYLTIESDTEIKSERTHGGVKGPIFVYVDSLENIIAK